MERSIWRKKPMSAFEADMKKSELKRVLTKWGLTSLGIGAIIGGGIFTLTGIAAHDHAGPALAIAFIIAAIGCTFASLCYSEFASILPVEGSAYAYSYGTIGEFFAWIIGWNLILEYMMGATTVAVAWSGYFEKFLHLFGIELPTVLMNDPYTAGEKLGLNGPTPAFNIAAFFITWIVTTILVRGIQESAKTNNIIVIVKLSVVIFVILVGAFFVKVDNWQPFIPERVIDADGTGHFGWSGVITAATIVFFAYIGFDAVSTQAGEAINPRKDVPFAIIASLVICTVLYILVSLVLTGMVKYDTLDLKAPVASAFADAGLPWAVFIITLAAVAGLTSVMLVMMLGQTRVFLGMAKDGLLPNFFKEIHPSFKTPWKSTLLVGLVVSVVSALTPIDKVSEMCSMGTLLAFAMISGAVLLLRYQKPDIERPYKAPAVWFVAPMGVLFNVFLMTQVRKETWHAFLIWSAIGITVYFLYSRNKSNLNKSES
ncbi:amino acid permease-associated region [Emticicia oligotrophica DSM 17448]|uniref:Amino acid permease-associated region n=1 Tax=Emticicia oligotrophica (strain DSM 17448 / CIP 109782 / MTCC 6937 / GPTSA100-15) TaxID=929562 RepID=A0ABN4APU7_EMTOG|nr:amino acid permease [Emticicia oligotrophica]AFK03194.1 amino acid permease-associated region [Emticicia oligotrophica DSM 17448]